MSRVDHHGVTSTSGPDRGSRNLLLRVIAAAVLAPLTIAIAYAGGWFWLSLVTAAALVLYYEWLMIVGASRNVTVVVAGMTALVFAATWSEFREIGLALCFAGAGAGLVAVLSRTQGIWNVSGLCYAAAALLASVLIRHDVMDGFAAVLFVLLVVWAADIGGYFAGRGIGGPKLWPRVSPKKTWAGAFGGLIGSVVVAAGFAACGVGRTMPLLLLGATLSIISQLGDLFESAVKRRFGVKDSSQIIPGHGGLLDRLDGFVAAVIAAAAIGIFRGGIDGAGRGLMVW